MCVPLLLCFPRLPGPRSNPSLALPLIPAATAVHDSQQGAILTSSDRGGIRIQYSKNPFGTCLGLCRAECSLLRCSGAPHVVACCCWPCLLRAGAFFAAVAPPAGRKRDSSGNYVVDLEPGAAGGAAGGQPGLPGMEQSVVNGTGELHVQQ